MVFWDYSHMGINFSLAGNGGPECAAHTPIQQRLVEAVMVTVYSSFILYKIRGSIHLPKSFVARERSQFSRRLLLVALSLSWGIEIGFKCEQKSVIFLLNPCHVLTFLQLYLLLADPTSRFVCAVFRFQMYTIFGTTLALVFPVLNTRQEGLESYIYYIQHILILLVPLYLMWIGGAYTPEALGDFSWALMSLAVLLLYHFVPLHALAVATNVNLNGMLCPSVSDPFNGPWYRVVAIGHQTLVVILHGKLYIYLAGKLLMFIRFVNFNLCKSDARTGEEGAKNGHIDYKQKWGE